VRDARHLPAGGGSPRVNGGTGLSPHTSPPAPAAPSLPPGPVFSRADHGSALPKQPDLGRHLATHASTAASPLLRALSPGFRYLTRRGNHLPASFLLVNSGAAIHTPFFSSANPGELCLSLFTLGSGRHS